MSPTVPLPTSLSKLTASAIGLFAMGLAIYGEIPTIAEFSNLIRLGTFIAGLIITTVSFALTFQWAKVEVSPLTERAQFVGGLTNYAALALFVAFAFAAFRISLDEKESSDIYEDRLIAVETKLDPDGSSSAKSEVYHLLGQCNEVKGSSPREVLIRRQCEEILEAGGRLSRSQIQIMIAELEDLR